MSRTLKPTRATRIASVKAVRAQATRRFFSGPATGMTTVRAASAMKPSFSTVTSSLTTSPERSVRGPGIPCTISSLTLMQVAPGKP